MVVGPHVFKWTYLLSTVEVQGTVLTWNEPNGDLPNDGFELKLDPGYVHLAANTSTGNTIHCETYPSSICNPTNNPVMINRWQFWPLPVKPANDKFQVKVMSTGQTRALAIQDHIRLRGRLLIENGHPQNTSGRGFLEIGYIFPELHPFDWTDIRLVETPVSGHDSSMLILAAPLYEMVYPGSWSANRTAGVADCLFLGDHGEKIHDQVNASVTISAGPPPPGVDPNTPVEYTEIIHHNGTGNATNAVRTITKVAGGITVSGSVTAPAVLTYDGLTIGNPTDPAQDKSVFCATYEVRWPQPNFGRLWHAVRNGNGSWTDLGEASTQLALSGPVRTTTATTSGQNMTQLALATEDGKLWHTIWNDGVPAYPLGSVNDQINIPGPVRALASATTAPGVAQFLLATEDGHLYHTIRDAIGNWAALGDVNGQFAIPSAIRVIAATCASPNALQCMFGTEDGHLYHTIRDSLGNWSGLGDVNGQFAIPGLIRSVAATSTNPGEAQFAFVTEDGKLWHTLRDVNGHWSGLGPVNERIPIPGPVHSVAATGAVGGPAQFLFDLESGELCHTARDAVGNWSGLGLVAGQVPVPAAIRSVSAAGLATNAAHFFYGA